VAFEDAREPHDLLEGEELVAREEFVVGPEHLRGMQYTSGNCSDRLRKCAGRAAPPARVEPRVERFSRIPSDRKGLYPVCVADRNDAIGHDLRSRIMKGSS